jgi:hypothetical protein
MTGRRGAGAAGRRCAIVLAFLGGAAGCGGLKGTATGRPGWSGFRAGELSFELPDDWRVRGDPLRLRAEPGDGTARLTVERLERAFGSESECLAQADEALSRGAAALERSRRHPTRLGGRPAIVQEGDSGSWHGWAWAACDGRVQYRISFAGVSPISTGILAARRGVEESVRFSGDR